VGGVGGVVDVENDLAGEVVKVGVRVVGQAADPIDPIEAIARVELAEAGAERGVLHPGEEVVGQELVPGHAPLERRSQEAAPVEEGAAGMRAELADQSRELLGQVLAVGVEDAEQAKVVPDAVVEDDLVAAAVAEVPRIAYRVDVTAPRSQLLPDDLAGFPR